ncbi:MAG: flagellar filament capping protein FliD, partial [Pseudomonadota bacterium]
TASASGDNKLVLATDNYGTSNSFTVSQTNDVVLGAAKDGTYAGVDIAGTINGEAATGSGQTLTGNADDANVDGLAIQYTGTSTGSVGAMTLTLGVAENLYKSLFYITDSYDGYLGFKQTSLQDNINRLETRITDEESSLDRKMESMIKQFISMEMALSKMQNQSSWLTSQISALSKGW